MTLLSERSSSSGLLLRLEYWDESNWGVTSRPDAEMTPALRAAVEPVRVDKSALLNLLHRMQAWLDGAVEFELELTSSEDAEQSMWVRIGPDARFISSSDKPVFEVRCRRGDSLMLGFAFVVDQSCIREFIQDRS
ncbi:hypothetical protein [Stenotrophomonas sp.]|uniref:hypothetical protein n=1 Tax=Stenotrophomonas sp. TaxID=69392 RepID=UPI003D6D8D53